MIYITLNIDKQAVYDEVVKSMSYIGAKSGDSTLYENMLVVDEDREMLELYWRESKDSLINVLQRNLFSQKELNDKLMLQLQVSGLFGVGITSVVESSAFTFFVSNIVSKWCMLSNKGEAEAYVSKATDSLLGVKTALMKRDRPTKPLSR